MTRTLVYIHWLDSAYMKECDDPKLFGPIRQHTVGWLLREDDECVVVAMEVCPDHGTQRDLMAIPHYAIIDRRDQEFELAAEPDS